MDHYAPKKLLDMDETAIGNTIETTWNQSKELKKKCETTHTRYNIAFTIFLVIGVAALFFGGSHLFVFAIITVAVLVKIYGQVKALRYEMNIALNNQIVAELTIAGIARVILGRSSS